MTLADHQRDMRDAFASGAPGMAVSGLVWLAAAAMAARGPFANAVLTLFGGGVLIFPLSVVACKLLGRRGVQATGNPLGALAMASTVWMIVCLPLAYVVAGREPSWFFPAMMCVIGGRYLVFQSIYGTRLYWVCGSALIIAAWALVVMRIEPGISAAAGGLIELVFAGVVWRRDPPPAR